MARDDAYQIVWGTADYLSIYFTAHHSDIGASTFKSWEWDEGSILIIHHSKIIDVITVDNASQVSQPAGPMTS